jgi:hypothetical protein
MPYLNTFISKSHHIMKYSTYLVAVTLFVQFSCTKKSDKISKEEPPVNKELSNGLGSNFSKINGYLYASMKKSSYGGSGFYYSLRAFASFGDPVRNLMSNYDHVNENTFFMEFENQPNITVGNVKFSDIQIGSKGTTIYNYNSNQSNSAIAISSSWDTEGNGPFKPIDLSVKRGFPQINSTSFVETISKNNDFTINTSNFVSNYDSVVVKIYVGSITITKRISSASSTITFKKEELSGFYNSYPYISYMAFNYSNMTVEDKSYVFELSNRLELPITFSN